MENNNEKEIWKKVKLNLDFEIDSSVKISNFGNVKTFNKQNDGNLLKGTMQEGYRLVKLRYYNQRDPLVAKKIASIIKKRKTIQLDINKTNRTLKTLKRNDPEKKNLLLHIEKQKAEIAICKLKYETLNKEENKARAVERSYLVHRLVAQYFLPKPAKDQKFVIHLDHNKVNNHVDNLRWANSVETAANWNYSPTVVAAREKRAATKGGFGKLIRSQVVSIKKKLAKGKTLRSIATEYGVSDMQIYRIKIGENWGHVVIE